MRSRNSPSHLSALLVTLALACSSRVPVDSQREESADIDLGARPDEPAQSYSECSSRDECGALPLCVFPSDEIGFCAEVCNTPNDASLCPLDPGETDRAFCLDIGLPSDERVCALDCSELPCPEGMRCEEVETDAGAEQVCF